MKPRPRLSRRSALKNLGAAGAAVASLPLAAQTADPPPRPARRPARAGDFRAALQSRIDQTPLIDTHEHLIEESDRLQGAAHPRVPCDDWALLCSHYLDSDFRSAGMTKADLDRFLSPKTDPVDKWKVLAPWWPAVRHTGYAQAVRLAMRQLYDVPDLSADTIPQIQAGYQRLRQPGFYRRILVDTARIESCQVNCLTGEPFKQSGLPTLLMQDLSIVGMFAGPNLSQYAPPTGLPVRDLADWHRVIDWWFDRYADYAVAVKSQHAYSRDLDYLRTPAEQAQPVFYKVLHKEPVSPAERKLLEDHLFWYAVDQATRRQLPVKLHTGFYAGHSSMPLARLRLNAGSAAELCRQSPDTRFVFMHIGYPYYEEFLALVKQWANAHIDLCWAWIINPAATKDYLKKHIVTAPINKLLPFGGDYIPVEPVVGHATLARRGLTLALAELVDEDWLQPDEAMDLIDPILHQNARRLFDLPRKQARLAQAPWSPPAP